MLPSDLKDAFRRNLAPRLNDYPSPDDPIWDTSGDCVCLTINARWSPFIIGVLDVLLQPSLWTGDPEPALASITELMLALNGDSETMNCNPITNITFEGGEIIIHYGDETTSVVEGSDRIVTGISATGIGWEVEQGGEFEEVPNPEECGGNCEEYPDKPAYEGSGNTRSCSIAENLVEFIMEKYQDCLDAMDAAGNVLAAADVILLMFPPAYIFWDAAIDTIHEVYDASVSVARALDTVGLREDMKTFLYCRLIENDHVMTEEIWDAFKEEFILIGDSIYLYLGQFKWEAIDVEAHKASYGEESGCETYDCNEDFCIDFEDAEEYTVTQGEWGSGYGEVGAGVRRIGSGITDWVAELIVRFTPSGETNGLTLRNLSLVDGSDGATRNHYLWVRGWNGTTYTNLYGTSATSTPTSQVDDAWHDLVASWSASEWTYIEVHLTCGGGVGSNIQVRMDNVCFTQP